MTETLPATGGTPPSDPSDIFAQIAQAQHEMLDDIGRADFDAALEKGTVAVRTLEHLLGGGGPPPGDEPRLRQELDIFRMLRAFASGLRQNLSRDFQKSAESFETVVRLGDQMLHPLGAAGDERVPYIDSMRHVAETRVPLMRAAEAIARGNPAEAARQLNGAEAVIAAILEKAEAVPGGGDPAQADEAAELARQQVLNIYPAFFIDAATIYVSIAAQRVDLDGAAGFFDRHLTRVRALVGQADGAAGEPSILTGLLGLAEASKALVDAYLALRDNAFDAALARFGEARTLFRKVSTSIPKGLPLSDMLRETSYNQVITGIPQMEERVRHEKSLHDRIRFLEAADAGRARELRDALTRREEIIKEMVPINLNVTATSNAESMAELKAQISNSVTLTLTLQNKGMDEVLRLLDEIGDRLPAKDTAEVRDKAKAAKEETDLAAKVKKVADVIESFGKIAEVAADFVPYGRVAYRILRSVFL
jgi:hypothetical protein